MKVLVPQDKTDGAVVLHTPINWMGGSDFEGTDGAKYGVGVVADVSDAKVMATFMLALRRKEPENYAEKRDYTREMRYFSGALADVPEGTEVKLTLKGRGYTLDIPESALPERATVNVGDTVAVTDTISPPALINARGVVAGFEGQKALVNLTAGDLRRVLRKTGKQFKNPVKLPKGTIERDDEVLVEVNG